jgi:exopolysaccharide biosynthesis protein
MLTKKLLSILLIFLISFTNFGQTKNFLDQEIKAAGDSIKYFQIETDSLFNSNQRISFLILPQKAFKKFYIKFSYCKSKLIKTSTFGENLNAIAAINGSFFDVDSGGSVCYLEVDDSVISTTRPDSLKWAKPDSLINGAVIITKDSKISIQPARSDKFYEQSKQEAVVMVSGPLLLQDSIKVKLPKMEFVTKRHPRTCLCTRKGSVLFIVIDGRSTEAEGMNLIEAQKYLQDIGCVDAINLDGGGSSTMWIRGRGVLNFPSDSTGERPVSDALLILTK